MDFRNWDICQRKFDSLLIFKDKKICQPFYTAALHIAKKRLTCDM